MGNLQKILSVSALAFGIAASTSDTATANSSTLKPQQLSPSSLSHPTNPGNPVNLAISVMQRNAAENNRNVTQESARNQEKPVGVVPLLAIMAAGGTMVAGVIATKILMRYKP